MMRISQRKQTILPTLILLSCLICSCDDIEYTDIKELEVIPGDEQILIQWEFEESCLDVYDAFVISRTFASGLDIWEDMVWSEPIDFRLATYWSSRYGQFLDTTADNGRQCYYSVWLVGSVSESFSEVDSGIPEDGFPNPRPDAPHGFSVSYSNDSSTIWINWIAPEGCDGLYYYYASDDSIDFDWTSDSLYDPVSLSSLLTVENRRDGSIEYYKFIALVDGILTEPSEPVLIIHNP